MLALFIGFINGLPGGANGDTQLPDHLGHVLHPAGREPGYHEAGDRGGGHQNVSDIEGFDSAKAVFASSFDIGGVTVKITVVWWFLFVRSRPGSLNRTRIGNWIFAVGGNAASAPARSVCR